MEKLLERFTEEVRDVCDRAPGETLVSRDDLEVVHGWDAVVVTVAVRVRGSSVEVKDDLLPQ